MTNHANFSYGPAAPKADNLNEWCEKHDLIGCVICCKSTVKVNSDNWHKANEQAQLAKAERKAANRTKREELRGLSRIERDLRDVPKTDNGYKRYIRPVNPDRGQFGLRPHS